MMGALLCEECKRNKPMAKIAGKYYCYECGRKVIMEHLISQLRDLERRGIISFGTPQQA